MIITGGGFATGTIDLGGIQVCQISSFTKVWATYEGGPGNSGATFFEPSSIPGGFYMLGSYSQSNNRLLFGRVLVAKDDTNGAILQQPTDYKLVWSSETSKINKEGNGYIWLPVAPEGYQALGHVVTNTKKKPPLEKIRCVRFDFTGRTEENTWIWGPGKKSDTKGLNIFDLRPVSRGPRDMDVPVGTFVARNPKSGGSVISLPCLKNVKYNLSCMPNLNQIDTLFRAYSPLIYFHPKETYLPSSVDWFFANGALLYTKGQESKPVPIEPTGSNLPQHGSNDGNYWLDLPVDEAKKERVKKGDLQSSQVYLHVKPMFGATYTDIVMWVFYPFNGAASLKVEFMDKIPLGKIGEHVGDWEHVTLRISNFNGELQSLYFSKHSGGSWVNATELEFQGGNRPCIYSSLHGHAMYEKPGLVLQGSEGTGTRNETSKSNMVLDTELRFSLVAAKYLGSAVVEPPWLSYTREWGPKISYDLGAEIEKVQKSLHGKFKLLQKFPKELLGQEGPTGPRWKKNWDGDEI